jgi:hypothetical protein
MKYRKHMVARPEVVWRYLAGRPIKHAVRADTHDIRGHQTYAMCGVSPTRFEAWMGTGNQDEYERVERLSECQRCVGHLL